MGQLQTNQGDTGTLIGILYGHDSNLGTLKVYRKQPKVRTPDLRHMKTWPLPRFL